MKSRCYHLGRLAGLFLLFGSVLTLAVSSLAFVVGNRVWATSRATFLFNPNFEDPAAGDPASQLATLQAAMNAWNGRSNFTYIDGGQTNRTTFQNDGVNHVHYSPGSSNGAALAVTLVTFNAQGLLDTDIRFYDDFGNGAPIVWGLNPNGSQFDIQHVATHEFGHALGLSHSGLANSIMFASSGNGNLSDELTFDDLLGLSSAYGHPTLSVSSVTPATIPGLTSGQVITVTGTGFVAGSTRVFLRRNNMQPERISELINVNILGPTLLTGEVLPQQPGENWPIAVRVNGDQTTRANNLFSIGNPDPPIVTSVVPSTGPLVGGNVVTIFGSKFTNPSDLSVTFGGVAAALGTVTLTEVEVTVPEGPGLGDVVVTLTTSGGASNGGYTYGVNPPALIRTGGSGRPGGRVKVELQGAPNRLCALLGDLREGTTSKGRLNLGLACSAKFMIIHDSFRTMDLPLDELGRREVVIEIPNRVNLAFRDFFLQGVVSEPGSGVTPTAVLRTTILP